MNANNRKNALRKEYLESIHRKVMETGNFSCKLKPNGVSTEDIRNEFKSFIVKEVAGVTLVARG